MGALIRQSIRALTPGAQAEADNDGLAIRADRNEAALPAPDHVLAAVRLLGGRDLSTYPSQVLGRVRSALALRLEVQSDRLVIGSGADDLLAGVGRAVLDPGDLVITVKPTFGMYAWLASVAGAELRSLNYERRWQLDLDALLAIARPAKLVILGHPNNPTGDALPPQAVVTLSRELPRALILVDEVYLSLSRDSLLPSLCALPNVVVVGSLSKVAALAGARVGYAVAQLELAGALRSVMLPFPIGVASLAAADAYLRGGSATARFESELAAQTRRSLDAIVSEVGCFAQNVWQSCGNFVLMDFGSDAVELVTALRARGVAVRTFSEPELAGCLRFCALDDVSTARFIAAFREAAAGLVRGEVSA
ncbi:MAG TPA: aminotransferase class I/II-fold pyridoxal phosphate-dependent enzyme [Candidatus Cybelea sp.]